MKKFISIFFAFVMILGNIEPLTVNAAKDNTVDILFVGNSFTHFGSIKAGVDSILQDLCDYEGDKIDVDSVINGKKDLLDYAYKSAYHNQFLKAIKSKQYDYISLQGIVGYGTCNKAITKLVKEIRKYQKNCKVLLFMTHAHGSSYKPKLINVCRNYTSAGYQLGIDVVDAGSVISYAKVNTNTKFLYKDNQHGSWASYYVGAVVFYNEIFGHNPKKIVLKDGQTVKDVFGSDCTLTLSMINKFNKMGDAEVTYGTDGAIEMTVGDKLDLKKVLKNSESKSTSYSFACSGKGYANVTSKGVVTAKKAGTAYVTAIAKNGLAVTIPIVVGKKSSVSAPTISSLKLSDSSVTEMTVAWNKVSNCSGYEIEYSRRSDFTNSKTIKIKSASTTSKKITGLYTPYEYYVRVRSYKDSTYSAWSAVKTIRTERTGMSEKTSILSLELDETDKTKMTVTVEEQAEPVVGYAIEYSRHADFTLSKTVKTTSPAKTSYNITGLYTGYVYYVRARVYGTKDGKTIFGPWSEAKTIKTE